MTYSITPDEIKFIIDLLNWVQHNNYIEFGENKYLQISGTAMGTPVAVFYATIFLARHE